MQDDLVWQTSDPSINHSKTVIENSPKKYLLTPEKSDKSLSTFNSEQTNNSKRSTEEEELRSLSTTPRYSHEDLGRIVSPPHSSDFTSTATDGEDFDDGADFNETLSAQQVFLRSRTTQYTNPNPLVITEEDLVTARRSELTNTHGSEYLNTHRSDVNTTHRSENIEISDHGSEQGWAKQVHQPYNKVFTIPEKGSAKTVQYNLRDKDVPDKSSLKSHTTVPELKARKEYHQKPNYTDHDFKKPLKPLSEVNLSRHLVAAAPHFARTLPPGAPDHLLRRASGAVNYGHLRAEELLEMRMRNIDSDLTDILMDAEKVQRDLASEQDHRRLLENHLQDVDEERKDLASKLATLRVKLGVANSNYNVSKNECDAMRKKYQETQIQKARLEERIQTCSKELEKLKDPKNPESNVNMKKVVLNDRKEIRRLRTDLEGVRSERSEMQKQIQDRDEKIKMLNIYIGEAKDQLDDVNKDFETAKISVVGERKKREEVEAKYNELLKGKHEFDAKMAEIQAQLDVAVEGTSGIYQQSEQYREKEQSLLNKIDVAERKLRDTLTAVEHEKNRSMPLRTATSIKHHQYRLSHTGMVTETTPHVIVTVDTNASLGASGFLGKTVVQTKPVKSLPAGKVDSKAAPGAGKGESKPTPRSKGGSLPAKK